MRARLSHGRAAITIATGRPVPVEDLPYLIGRPVISGIGGLILLAMTRRVPGVPGVPREPIG